MILDLMFKMCLAVFLGAVFEGQEVTQWFVVLRVVVFRSLVFYHHSSHILLLCSHIVVFLPVAMMMMMMFSFIGQFGCV